MSWSNYMIMPQYKLMFRMSRYIDMAKVEDFRDRFDAMLPLTNEVTTILDLNPSDVTTVQSAKITLVADKASLLINEYMDDFAFCSVLMRHDPGAFILSELELDKIENIERFKDYKRIG